MILFFVSLFIVLSIPYLFPEKQPRIVNERGKLYKYGIAKWEKVELGNCEQWISIRGSNRNNPLILFLHGGPGTPETPFLFKYHSDLEKNFVVVSWDQRGAGKSFSEKIPPESLNLDQLVSDTHELTQYLLREFEWDKIFLAGHDWGTVPGIRAVYQRPENYSAYIAIAQRSDGSREELLTYRKVLQQAEEAKKRGALKELANIGEPKDGVYAGGDKALEIKLKWVRFFGGGEFHQEKSLWPVIKQVLITQVYSPGERLKYLKGKAFSLKYLSDDLRTVQLQKEIKRLDLPVYFFHGVYDNMVPLKVAREFFDGIEAPEKDFYIFNNSAHGVLSEEPEKFCQIMNEISKN